MKIQEMLSVLSEQKIYLDQLNEYGKEKQIVLVNNNGEKINEIVLKEEKLLLAIQMKEDERIKLMEVLFKQYKIDNKTYKINRLITGLIGKVNSKILNEIVTIERAIKVVIKEITKINSQNLLLIQQSRSLLNDTIHAVVNNNQSIVDRKG